MGYEQSVKYHNRGLRINAMSLQFLGVQAGFLS